MKKQYIQAEVKAVAREGESEWDIEVLASSGAVDRDGEVIHQEGWELDDFKENPVFMAAHQHRLADGRSPVIGKFVDIGVGPAGLAGRVKFAPTELGQEYAKLYRGKFMRAVSVGFMPLESEMRPDEPKGGRARKGKATQRRHILRAQLWEVSAVAVGANQEALARLEALAAKSAGGGDGGGAEYVSRAELEEAVLGVKSFIMEQVDTLLMIAGDSKAMVRLAGAMCEAKGGGGCEDHGGQDDPADDGDDDGDEDEDKPTPGTIRLASGRGGRDEMKAAARRLRAMALRTAEDC